MVSPPDRVSHCLDRSVVAGTVGERPIPGRERREESLAEHEDGTGHGSTTRTQGLHFPRPGSEVEDSEWHGSVRAATC